MKYYLTKKQAQDIDHHTQEVIGIPGIVLMERAAEKLAFAIDAEIKAKSSPKLQGFDKKNDKILAVAESGNNGGDAVAAVRILKTLGYNTAVFEIGELAKKTESYLKQVEIAKNLGVEFLEEKNPKFTAADYGKLFAQYPVIVDGIFGVGLAHSIKDVHKTVIDGINLASGNRSEPGETAIGTSFVTGCDIPSGISADNGAAFGIAVKCDMTVTFEYTKYGMLVNDGRICSGKIICERIGLYRPKNLNEMIELFGGEENAPYLHYEFDDAEIAERIPTRNPNSNKGTYGRVLIVSGSKEVYGALYLSAMACYKTGAGLVKVVTDVRNRDLLMEKLPEAMMLTYDSDAPDKKFAEEYVASIKWADVILIGPGLGTEELSGKLLNAIVTNSREGQNLILDADALNIIAKEDTTEYLRHMVEKVGDDHVFITPHMTEMSRLLKGLKAEMPVDFIRENRERIAAIVSDPFKIVCILKDARTIVSHTGNVGGRKMIYVNTTGNSGMSKGGSGDVLAGILAALVAQNKEGRLSNYELSCVAVNLHGKAGDAACKAVGETKMLAGDIIENIPAQL